MLKSEISETFWKKKGLWRNKTPQSYIKIKPRVSSWLCQNSKLIHSSAPTKLPLLEPRSVQLSFSLSGNNTGRESKLGPVYADVSSAHQRITPSSLVSMRRSFFHLSGYLNFKSDVLKITPICEEKRKLLASFSLVASTCAWPVTAGLR